MSTETPEARSPEAIRREMKIRFDAVNSAAEQSHRLRREMDDKKYAIAHNITTKLSDNEHDSAKVGENDSLGG
jgi:hypothetical protein